jgi:hypothetical protein
LDYCPCPRSSEFSSWEFALLWIKKKP